MRFGLSVPPFTDPAEVVALAVSAEASGWDGFFLWDHLSWDGVVDAHDPWVLLGAIAMPRSDPGSRSGSPAARPAPGPWPAPGGGTATCRSPTTTCRPRIWRRTSETTLARDGISSRSGPPAYRRRSSRPSASLG